MSCSEGLHRLLKFIQDKLSVINVIEQGAKRMQSKGTWLHWVEEILEQVGYRLWKTQIKVRLEMDCSREGWARDHRVRKSLV